MCRTRGVPRVLPRFVFAIPDSCHDMHDCSVAAEQPLAPASRCRRCCAAVPSVIITFDEGVTGAGGGGHIYTAMEAEGCPEANAMGTDTPT